MTGSSRHADGTDLLMFYADLREGGIQRMMVVLADELAARGVETEILVAQTGRLSEQVKAARASVMGTNTVFQTFVGLCRHLRRTRPKAVFSAHPNYNLMAVAASYLIHPRPRIILSDRTDIIALYRNARRFGLFKLSIMLAPLTYRLADRIVAVSKGTAESLRRFCRLSGDRISVIYNPAYSDRMKSLSAEPVNLPWIAARSDTIVSAGRFVHQKNHALLIEAFAICLRVEPGLKLILLGDGEERDAIQALVKARGLLTSVHMPGAETNPFRWFSQATVFVLSSRFEGFGNVLVEAMACGCSVVATDCPSGPREILGDGAYGHLVPVDDAHALAQAMIAALRNPRSHEILLSRAQSFSAKAAADRYLELLR